MGVQKKCGKQEFAILPDYGYIGLYYLHFALKNNFHLPFISSEKSCINFLNLRLLFSL